MTAAECSLAGEGVQLTQYLVDHPARRQVFGVDQDMRQFPVEGFPDAHELSQPAPAVIGEQQWTVLVVRGALQLLLDRGMQINHDAALAQSLAVFRAQYGASSRGEDNARLPGEFFYGLDFTLAKAFLTLDFEDQGNAGAGAFFDDFVRVDELIAERTRQKAPGGAFAGAHGADQKETARIHGGFYAKARGEKQAGGGAAAKKNRRQSRRF